MKLKTNTLICSALVMTVLSASSISMAAAVSPENTTQQTQGYRIFFLPEKSLPMDYTRPDTQPLNIFYRFIPANGSKVDDVSKPVIVVINGGPGLPSSGYRAYDYNYRKMPADKLSNLTKKFHVLIMDQRGTKGNSTALDMNKADLDYQAIARFFSADSIARDQQAVINKVLGPARPFYMIAQSFGGLVGFQYMRLPDITRKPTGIVFSSAAMPFNDSLKFNLLRRQSQKDLNLQLKAYNPSVEKLVMDLKKHFTAIGLNPDYVNTLWKELGAGKDGVWQAHTIKQIKSMLVMNKKSIEKIILDSIGRPNLLNIILSSANMTPGWTDTTLSIKSMHELPFQPWMLDEEATYIDAASGHSTEARNIQRIDKQPPAPVSFGTAAENKKAVNSVAAMFTFGGNDAMTPTSLGIEHMRANFYIADKTKYATLPGGHQAIFLDEGVALLEKWIGDVSH